MVGVHVVFGGLSPPMRGSPIAGLPPILVKGSIPAHAGEPGLVCRPPCSPGVYPRPCGGAVYLGLEDGKEMGLSPPMRGSLQRFDPAFQARGSIPAHAGEPRDGRQAQSHGGVYPRPCGGALRRSRSSHASRGLSPPMRGSRPPGLPGHRGRGSIPAHAGEPSGATGQSCGQRVYPRPCGGASGYKLHNTHFDKLSKTIKSEIWVYIENIPYPLERTIPSTSINPLGGTPRHLMPSPPANPASRHTITKLPPPSSSNHPDTTFQSLSRTAGFIRGEVYTPGAISKAQEAKKPLNR